MKNNYLKYILFFILSVILVFIDQITKRIAYVNLFNKEPYAVVDNVLYFVYVENKGAAFGILQNQFILFLVLTIFVILIIIIALYKLTFTKNNMLYYIFLLLIFSGAIGNFIDRIKNKYVVDFIYFKPIDFPVFNFADILITCGCLIMLYIIIFTNKDDI